MADESATTEETEAGAPVEMRPCAFCGNMIHPSSHRCTHCGGHVGLAWGTVHAELFLFLFLSVLVAVGCLASWTGRTPAASAKVLQAAQDKAEARAKGLYQRDVAAALAASQPTPPADDPKYVPTPMDSDVAVWDTVVPSGLEINGLDTLRGSLMFAIAVFGLIIGVFNLLYRRLVMWPFVISGMLALWVGLAGVFSAAKSSAWERWTTWGKGHNLSEEYLAKIRAIPPGHLLLTIAGIVLMIKLVGGILAVATKGKPGADEKEGGAAARSKRRGKAAEGDAAAGAAGAGGSTPNTPPATPPK